MIVLDNITFGYPDTPAILENLSLAIAPSERLVLLGASGSGKTTLLRLLAGFAAPNRGAILFDGICAARDGKILLPPRERDTTMVFQDFALWPHMNVEENIGFGLRMKGVGKKERRKHVDAFLEMIGMRGYNQKQVRTLSGGEQQRVALARALIVSPKLLLMDEPLSNLDEEQNIRLRGEIIRLQERFGTTLVYVTHNRDEAESVATRIVTMRNGRIGS